MPDRDRRRRPPAPHVRRQSQGPGGAPLDHRRGGDARRRPGAGGRDRSAGIAEAADAARQAAVRDGTRGLRKVIDGREDELTPAEQVGLEAIVLLEGRPPLFIQGGDFRQVPIEWDVLNRHREKIRSSIARVGRIEVDGHPELRVDRHRLPGRAGRDHHQSPCGARIRRGRRRRRLAVPVRHVGAAGLQRGARRHRSGGIPDHRDRRHPRDARPGRPEHRGDRWPGLGAARTADRRRGETGPGGRSAGLRDRLSGLGRPAQRPDAHAADLRPGLRRQAAAAGPGQRVERRRRRVPARLLDPGRQLRLPGLRPRDARRHRPALRWPLPDRQQRRPAVAADR